MQDFSCSPKELVSSILRNRNLINSLTQREVIGRYRGSVLGLLWSFITPLFMLAIYTFFFSVVFQARWGDSDGTKTEFALVLFAGLLIFNLFSECVTRAPNLIISNANFVKKVVFPLDVLPTVVLLSGLFHFLVSLGVWVLAYMLFFGMPHLTIFLLPMVVLPFCFLLLGLSFILASLGVFIRDISQFIGMLTTAIMFMSPIFYPVSSFPEDYRYILLLNPLTSVIDQTRNLLFWGNTPDLFLLGVSWFISLCVAWLGFVWFQITRKGFADVL